MCGFRGERHFAEKKIAENVDLYQVKRFTAGPIAALFARSGVIIDAVTLPTSRTYSALLAAITIRPAGTPRPARLAGDQAQP